MSPITSLLTRGAALIQTSLYKHLPRAGEMVLWVKVLD